MRSVPGGLGLVALVVLVTLPVAATVAHDRTDAGVHAELVRDLAPAHGAPVGSITVAHRGNLVDGHAGLVRPGDETHRAAEAIASGEVGELGLIDREAVRRQSVRGMSDVRGIRWSLLGLVLGACCRRAGSLERRGL